MGKMMKIAAPLLLFMVLIAAVIVIPMVSEPSPIPKELSVVEEAWQGIVNDYVDKDKLDLNALSEGAIKGMLEAAGDPYAAYFSAEEFKEFEKLNIEGASYGGIGASVTISGGQLVVVMPFEKTPAQEEGIRPGDLILEIDGELTEGMTLEEAALKMHGEPGTQVTLKVLHRGEEDPIPVVIIREQINVPSVYSDILTEGIAHIRITQFTRRTGSELVSALEEALEHNVTGVVLDLRDNAGGLVDSAVSVASQFLKEGIVLYALYGNGEKETWNVEAGGLAADLPLAVLVNENSISASEIVAGALQDYGRGVLIGTTTFGKGKACLFRQLSDGSAIYISIGRWYTPNGRQIEGNGLTPDIVVERTDEHIAQDKDPQLDKAIEYIQSQL